MTRDVQSHQEAPQAEVQAQTSEDPLPNLDDDDGALAEPSHSWEIDPETGEIVYQDVMMEGDGDDGLDDEPDCEADYGEDGGGYEGMEVDSDSLNAMHHRHPAFAGTVGLKPTPFDSIQKPQPPPKPRTPSWDSRGVFRASPYPVTRSVSGAGSTPSSMSPPSSATTAHQRRPSTRSAPASRSSQTSSTKGKSTLEQMKTNLKERLDGFDADYREQKVSSAVLKNERYNMKMQAFMRDKEISFLESQRVTERAEAEDMHRHQLEVKKSEIELRRADAEVLDKEREVLALKLRLAEFTAAKLQSGSTIPSASDCGGSSNLSMGSFHV
ncbi:hypothetical protein BU15DRAFT_65906 [Melanogaster broomeanus]|nr:hypothetical protein BU15DRAFT_65906 [Melanogaster broomeanus]